MNPPPPHRQRSGDNLSAAGPMRLTSSSNTSTSLTSAISSTSNNNPTSSSASASLSTSFNFGGGNAANPVNSNSLSSIMVAAPPPNVNVNYLSNRQFGNRDASGGAAIFPDSEVSGGVPNLHQRQQQQIQQQQQQQLQQQSHYSNTSYVTTTSSGYPSYFTNPNSLPPPSHNPNTNSFQTQGISTITTRSWRPVHFASGAAPSPRSGAASVVINDKLILFGGYGGSGRLDDLWTFDFASKTWTPVEYDGPGPGPRENNGVIALDGKLYLFGGYNGFQWLSDLHEFDLAKRRWRLLEPRGTPPASRFGYVSASYCDARGNKELILFAGYDGTTWLNDMFSYSFSTGEWSKKQQYGEVPSIRSCPSWARHGDSVFVFGGYDGVQRMNDFFELDLPTCTWRAVRQRGVPPSPRYFHASVVLGSQLLVYGGYSGSTRLADLHAFDLETHTWSKIEAVSSSTASAAAASTASGPSNSSPTASSSTLNASSNNPSSTQGQQDGNSPTGRSSLVAQVYGNSFWVLGGYNGSQVLNDMYELVLEDVVVPPPTLLDDLARLVDNRELGDVCFVVEGREVHTVKALLAARSEHFRALLYGGMRESIEEAPGKLKRIPIEDVAYGTFLLLLEFLFTDAVRSTPLTVEEAVPLLIAAERFLLTRLKQICADAIRKRIEVSNVVHVLLTSYRHNASALKEICLDYIIDHLDAVKRCPEFAELKKEPDLLIEIVMRSS